MNILVIGAGGVGTSAAKIIKRAGEGGAWAEKIILADYDFERAKLVAAECNDERFVAEKIDATDGDMIKEVLKKHNITADQIDFFVPHVSSHYFVDGLNKTMIEYGIGVPMEKWFMNLATVGNVGAGSIYLAVEELMGSGKLKKGDKIFLSVPESGRFSYAYAYLTVC